MTKKKGHPSRFTRLVTYPIIGIIFIVVLFIIILLATGYKFTFQDNHLALKKTGMIIVYTHPNDAKIYLNGKNLKKTTLPFISTKINSLIPGIYNLEIKKNGYITWHKTLTIYPDLVTWANYVLLFPESHDSQKLDNLAGYKIDGANKTNRYFLVEKTDQNGAKTFKEYDSNSKELKDVWPQNVTPIEKWLQNPEITAADFSSDSHKILLTIKNSGAINYAILDLSNSTVSPLATTPAVQFGKLVWNPSNNNELVGLSNGALYRIQTDVNPVTATKFESGVVDYSVLNGSVYYVAVVNQKYVLNRIQTDGSKKTVIAESVLPSASYKFQYASQHNTLALLAKDSGTLTVYYNLNNLFSSITLGKNISDMSWSKDGNKLNFFNQDNIYCYDWEKQKELSTKTDTKINKMVWYYDNYHLFYRDNNTFGVVEFDGGNKTKLADNVVAAYVVNQSSFFYVQNENKISNFYRLNISF